jgi:D-hexose-6-phosphate mutarotase
MSAELLNRAFGIPGRLGFRSTEGGLVVAEVTTAAATASICLQGGHLMAWQPRSTVAPVIKLTERARLLPGKALRGGIPVCWPWFGPHDSEMNWPAHGYARTAAWQVASVEALPDEAIRMELQLSPDAASLQPWKLPAKLSMAFVIGSTLKVDLITQNMGGQPLRIGEALHTYLHVSDVEQVELTGLEGCAYVDKVQGGRESNQRGAVKFSAETDSVYLDTTVDCVIADPGLGRHIRVTKSGSQSTVVWNPWQDKASRMDDVGADGWCSFLCVETANALRNSVTVPAHGSHTLTTEISVEE